MKKLVLLLILSSSLLFSAIDEYKTDIYFANGIFTVIDDAQYNVEKVLDLAIIEKLGYDEYKRRIGEVGYSYNQTEGLWDIIEAMFQRFDWDDALDYMLYNHHVDVERHVIKYKNRILQGHKVLVVAHSQGNLFALDTYEALGKESEKGWMQNYFEAVSIASPMTQDIKTGTKRIDWDNDPVPRIASSGRKRSWMDPNKVRNVSWVLQDSLYDDLPYGKPDNYIYEHNLGETHIGEIYKYKAVEDGIDIAAKVHAFEFYMGVPLLKGTSIVDGETKKIYYQDPFDNNNLTTDLAKKEIMKAIDDQLVKLEKVPSQWVIVKGLGCTCKEKRIHVTHAHDSSLDFLIYGSYINYAIEDRPNHPFEFSGNGKIYYVSNGSVPWGYVRAPQGGTHMETREGSPCYILKDSDGGKVGSDIKGPKEGAKECTDDNKTCEEIAQEIRDTEGIAAGDAYADANGCGADDNSSSPSPDDNSTCVDGKYPDGEPCESCIDGIDSYGEPCDEKCDVVPVLSHDGALKMTLSWTYPCDIDMDLTMTGNDAVVYDIKDVERAGKEHLYIPTLFDMKPEDKYTFNANGRQLPDSLLTEEMLAEDPIEVRALLETTKGDYFNVWPVESFASLNLGNFAEVSMVTEDVKWVCPAISDAPDWYSPYNTDTGNFQCLYCPSPYSVEWNEPPYDFQKGSWYCKRPYGRRSSSSGGGRIYNACSEEEKKGTCGCVPCDYIVAGMQKRIENGPIAGAKVEIIKASDADGINPAVLYRGSTTDKEDIFQSGLLEIPDATLDTFEDDEYYLVLAEGGKDIDRDDNMVRDGVPTENNGTIHALLKGSDLKKSPFRVNILTEAIYQVSGDCIGLNYDALALQTKLDTTAQKLINHKLYPGDDDNRINYKDILVWTPAVDKKALYKPFTIYVEPIIESLYADKERFDESYRLIYADYNSDAPQLEPLALEIPEGLDNDVIIAQIKTYNYKTFEHIVLQGNFSEHFSVNNEGYIHIAKTSLIEESNRYRLQMKAVDEAGREGGFVSLLIKVKGQIVKADPTTSSPRFISVETFDTLENSPEGTVVLDAHFEDSNQTIVSYSLSGEDNTSFSVDDKGVVTVSSTADIDYEKSKVYCFAISAMNDAGNQSYPVAISIPIVNQLDTPLFDLVILEHVEENTPLGSVITTIRADREGLGAIEKFEILSPHMPFTIDNNGTIYVSNYIDYEQEKQYDFYAIARTKYGNSNKIEIHIVVDNQSPEIGVPTLEDLIVAVDENISSGSIIGQLVLDTGATSIERIALYGEDDNFRVDNNGSIYVADDARLDYETKTRYDLGARALNSRGYGNEVHIVIEVKNTEDEPPTFMSFKGSIGENAVADTKVGQLQMSSQGESEISSIELIGTGSENFTIDTNGTIRVSDISQLDYESKKSYALLAIISSEAGTSSEMEVVIYVLNLPEHIPVLKAFTGSVEENASIGTVVGQTEEDVGGDSPIVSYALDDNASFSIDTNGTIRVNAPLDYELQTTYTLAVTASNVVGESTPATVSINITNIIDDEPVLNGASFSLLEDSTVGTTLGIVGVNSAGTSAINSMRLEGIGSEKFSIDVNGTVKLVQTADYESKKVYNLRAIATNAKADSPETSVTINVLNIAEHPPVLYAFKGFVEDNATAGTTIGEIAFATRGDSLVNGFVLTGNGKENFKIDINGTLSLSDNPQLDENVQKIYNLSLVAQNSAGGSTPSNVEIVLTHDKVKPYKPSSLKLLDIGHNSITLGWVDNAHNERGFNLYIDGVKYITLNPDTTSYRVTGLEEETTYVFTLKSFNDRGESIGTSIEGITDIDRSEYLKAVLEQKCSVSASNFYSYFNADTGHYNSSIYCHNKALTDKDLLNFKALKSVSGYLYLSYNSLTNVDGLSNLKSVGRELELYNNQLTNVDGLNKLTSVGREFRLDNNQLTNVNGLSVLTSVGYHFYLNNNKLTNVNGLSALTSVGSYFYLHNNQLTNVDGLSSLTTVGNNFYLYTNQIANIDGLSSLVKVGGSLHFGGNQLSNLDSLAELTDLGGYLAIKNNPDLIDISGAENIVGKYGKLLHIDSDQYSTKADGNSSLCSATWDLRNASNVNIPDDMGQVCEGQEPYLPEPQEKLRDVLEAKCSVTTANFYSYFNADTGHYSYYIWCGGRGLNDDDLLNFKALKSVRYGLYLDRNNLTNVDGLSNLKNVGYDLYLYNNQLANVDGLTNLTSVGSSLRLDGNQFSNVDGLSNLTNVGYHFYLNNNQLTNVNGLSSLANVGSYFYLQTNQLTNVDGLSSLTRVGSNFNVEGNQLTNLNGLSSITSLGGYLALRGNSSLTDISGVGNAQSSNGRLLYINPNQYTTKAREDSNFCSTVWDLRDTVGNIADDMTQVCDMNSTELTPEDKLRNVLGEKCAIDSSTFYTYFNTDTGYYSSSIYCSSKGLTDEDLLSFKALKSIGGYLYLNNNNLTNVDGLSGLKSVGNHLYLYSNQLTNVDGLSNLTSVGSYFRLDGNQLTNVNGLSALTSVRQSFYLNNNKLTNVNGLRALISVGYYFYLQTNQLTNVDGLSSLTSVGSNLNVESNQITNLDGLVSLISLGGSLSLRGNADLTDISGVSNIQSSNGKLLYINPEQYSVKADDNKSFCSTVWDLRDPSGNIADDMTQVCDSVDPYLPSDVDNLRDVLGTCGISSSIFYSYFNTDTGHYSSSIYCSSKGLTDEDLLNFKALKSISGYLYLNNNNLTNVDGLSGLKSVGNHLYLYSNQLTNVDGLSNLTSVGSYFRLDGNQLTNVNGLSALTSVGYYFYLQTNQLTNVDGLSSLTNVGSNFNVENNQLTSLDGLVNLTSLGGSLALRGNADLTDISGVSNIQSSNGKLLYINLDQYEVKANEALKFCSTVWNMYDPSGDITDDMSLVCDAGTGLTDVQKLRAMMEGKCSVSFSQFANNFDEDTGVYTGSVDCSHKKMNNDELIKFTLLNQITGSLSINDNNLTTLDGLNNLTSIGGYFYLQNNKIEDISGLGGLVSVDGSFDMSNNSMLDVDMLSTLTTISGELKIYRNSNLSDIYGLSNIVGIDGKKIYIDSTEYSTKATLDGALCAAQWDIYSQTENIEDDMSKLCEGYNYEPTNTDRLRDLFGKRCTIDSITFYSNFTDDSGIYNGNIKCQGLMDEEMTDFEGLLEVNGNFRIEDSNIINLDGLMRVKRVTGSVSISGNQNLSDIYGLSNIAGNSNQKLIIDDTNQYDVKADSSKDFCTTSWDIYDGVTNIANDMSKVCDQ